MWYNYETNRESESERESLSCHWARGRAEHHRSWELAPDWGQRGDHSLLLSHIDDLIHQQVINEPQQPYHSFQLDTNTPIHFIRQDLLYPQPSSLSLREVIMMYAFVNNNVFSAKGSSIWNRSGNSTARSTAVHTWGYESPFINLMFWPLCSGPHTAVSLSFTFIMHGINIKKALYWYYL